MSYWVKLIHSDSVIADSSCLLRSLDNILLRTYAGKTLISVDDAGELVFSKDFTATPLSYVASQTGTIQVQVGIKTVVLSDLGEVTSAKTHADKLGVADAIVNASSGTLDGELEICNINGQFGLVHQPAGSNPTYLTYTGNIATVTTSMGFVYFSVVDAVTYLAFFQVDEAASPNYLRLQRWSNFSSGSSLYLAYTDTDIDSIKYEAIRTFPSWACINFRNTSDGSWQACIISNNFAARMPLANSDVLRYLDSDTEFTIVSGEHITHVYLTAILSGATLLRKYAVNFTDSTLTLEWSKEFTLNGSSYDFICAGVVRGDSLILSIVETDGKDIYLCKFPKDCIKNGVYGDIIVSDGSTTALASTDIVVDFDTRSVTTVARPSDSSSSSLVSPLEVSQSNSDMSVDICGSLPFTPEIPNRDAFIDFTSYFTSTATYVEASNTFLIPTGSISAIFTCVSYKTFFCRYLKVNYLITATVANVKIRLYDTQGTIVGESTLQDLTAPGYLILSIKETGYPLSYITLYKASVVEIELSLGLTVPTWSFPPQTSYNETREYLTDISDSKEDEIRSALRELPRTNLRYSNLFKTTPEFVQAKLVSEASVDGFISAPLWHDLTTVTGLLLGDTSISLDNTAHEWGVGTKLIIWGNYNTYEITTITLMGLSSITIADPLLRDYTKAYIMPLITGILPNGVNFQFNNNNRTADFSLLSTETYFEEALNSPFIDLDGSVLTDSFGEFLYPEATDYVGHPLLEGTLINEGISLNYAREGYVNDNEIGLLSKTDNLLYTRTSSNVTLVARDSTEIFSLKRKLDGLQGRFASFWLPSKENDLQFSFTNLTSGDASFDVTFNQMAITQPKYLHIIGDVEVIVEVARISNNYDDTETIHLLSALTTDILAITSIEIVHLMRSATDSFDIRYFNRNKAIVSFPVISVAS